MKCHSEHDKAKLINLRHEALHALKVLGDKILQSSSGPCHL